MNRGLFQILGSVWLCSFAAGQLPPPPTQADYIDYVKARTHFRLWRDGRIADFQITGWLKEGLSSAEVEKVFEIVKSGKVGDRVQETLWNSLSIGCQMSVSTNSARGSFGLSYTSPSPEGGTTRVGITHAGLFTIIVRAGGRTNTVTVPTPMGCVPGCGDPTLAVIKDLESTLFHMARKRREPSQAGKRAGYPGCEQGSALLHNKIWNAFKEKNEGMKKRPHYVIGFGIGLISKMGYEAAEVIPYR